MRRNNGGGAEAAFRRRAATTRDDSAPPADLAIVNGDVRTMVPGDPGGHEAVGIRAGRVALVGSTAEIRAWARPGTTIVDAEGATVLPGFIDAHCHWGLTAKTFALSTYVGTPPISTIDELVAAGRQAAARTPAGEWVLLQGSVFQDRYLAERRYPSSADLDRVSTAHPVLYRAALHTVVLNRAGLAAAGITATTVPPPGAHIERDPATGEPTGVLHDMWVHLPLPTPTRDQLRAEIARIAREHLLGNGVTTVHEIWDSGEMLAMQAELIRLREVPLRVVAFGWVGPAGTVREVAEGRVPGVMAEPDWLVFKGVKLFADGGTSARTAALFEDYTDRPGHRGELTYADDDLLREMVTAYEAGAQILVHAAGDRSYDQVLRLAERMPRARPDRPTRIEHGGNHSWNAEFARRCRATGVLPVPNVGFIGTYGEMWPESLGPERAAHMVPLRTMFGQGFPVPGTSDTTGGALATLSPLHNIWRAVTRRSQSGLPVSPHEAITLDEALAMYTRHGALAAGEHDRGVLAPGRLGDVVVLSANLTGIDPDALPSVTVAHTIVGGHRV